MTSFVLFILFMLALDFAVFQSDSAVAVFTKWFLQ